MFQRLTSSMMEFTTSDRPFFLSSFWFKPSPAREGLSYGRWNLERHIFFTSISLETQQTSEILFSIMKGRLLFRELSWPKKFIELPRFVGAIRQGGYQIFVMSFYVNRLGDGSALLPMLCPKFLFFFFLPSSSSTFPYLSVCLSISSVKRSRSNRRHQMGEKRGGTGKLSRGTFYCFLGGQYS